MSSPLKNIVFSCMAFFMTLQYGNGQCGFHEPIEIPDFSTTQIFVNVSGAINNNLTTNGVCRININFRHQTIGDLIIELISPAGELITLVGPSGAFGSTDFTTWDVSFVPCASQAFPDVGFSAQWSNNQFWGAFGNYAGSYYPYDGCLEDFDVGSVNGVWTLNVLDNQQFDVGSIQSFELIFCDPSGIDCAQCNPPDVVMVEDDFTVCTGSDLLSFNPELNVTYPDSSEAPLYDTLYLVSNQDTVIESDTFVDMTSYLPGIYYVCGFLIPHYQVNLIQEYLDTSTITEIKNDLNGYSPEFCASITQQCLRIEILEQPDTIVIKENICEGDTFEFRGQKYSSSGIYYVTSNPANNCDTTYELRITEIILESIINPPSKITCYSPTILLDASGSVYPSASLLKWFTHDGNIIGSATGLTIQVNRGGTYYFVVRKYGCSDTSSITVIEDNMPPDINVSDDTLTCGKTSLRISAHTSDPYDSLIWYGPGNFISHQLQPVVDRAGTYTLIIRGSNGCIDTFNTEISIDTIVPSVTAIVPTVNCEHEMIPLDISEPYNPEFSYQWTSNSGFNAHVKDTSTYAENTEFFIRVENENNNCIGSDSFTVNNLIELADIFIATQDTLDCYTDSIRILNNTVPDSADFLWTGPDGFISRDKSPYVYNAGTYYLDATTENLCVAIDSITVYSNDFIPDLTVSNDTFFCHSDTIVLYASSSESVTYSWSGPGGYKNDSSVAPIVLPGEYKVTITTPGGCINVDSVVVTQNFYSGGIDLISDTLTCADSTARVRYISSEVDSFYWFTSEGNYVYDSTFIINTPGYQFFFYIDTSGCQGYKAVYTRPDFNEPLVLPRLPAFGCSDDSLQITLDSTTAVTYSWSGPGNFTSSKEEPWVYGVGAYYLESIGENGCVALDTFNVGYDTIHPMVNIIGQDFNCTLDSIELSVKEHESGFTYKWEGPAGFNSSLPQPTVTEDGKYYVTITGSNGCHGSDEIEIGYDTIPPVIDVIGDTLMCHNSTITLYASANVGMVNYTWHYGGQIKGTDDSLKTGQEGVYTIVGESPNTCKDTITYYLHADTNIPDFSVKLDTLTCDSPFVFPVVEIDTSLITSVEWTGPGGYVSDKLEPKLSVGGDYTFRFTVINGCQGGGVYTLNEDLSPPPVNLRAHYHLNCDTPSILLDSELSESEYQISWEINGNIVSNKPTYFVEDSTEIIFRAQGENHCELFKKITITENFTQPRINVTVDTITCYATKVQAEVDAVSDSYSYHWTSAQGFSSQYKEPSFNTEGFYTVEVSDTNGCRTTLTIAVEGDTLAPVINVKDGNLSCDDSTYQLKIRSASPLEKILWFGPGNFYSELKAPIVNEIGYYRVIAISPNGCFSYDTLYVDDNPEFPEIRIDAYGIDCYADSINVRIVPRAGDDYIYHWKYNNKIVSTSISPHLNGNLKYHLTVIDTFNGCTMDTLITFHKDSILPVAEIIQLDPILCKKNIASLSVIDTMRKDVYDFNWEGIDNGLIISDPTLPVVSIKGAGRYLLQLIDTRNGCIYMDTILVDTLASDLKSMELLIDEISCFQLSDGRILIQDVQGGVSPYEYSVNQGNFSNRNTFTELDTGVYRIKARDKYGCEVDTIIVLDYSELPMVQLDPDTIINFGEIVSLMPEINPDTARLQMRWTPINGIGCPTCAHTIASPPKTIIYTFTIADSSGCRASDKRKVSIRRNPNVYVPSAFTPNGDKNNDNLRPFFSDIVKSVEEFSIYDRWGNVMFSIHNIAVDDISSIAWDGTAYGKALAPQVFVYKLIYSLDNGRTLHQEGTITLIR